MKNFILIILIFITGLLSGCGVTLEEEAYRINQKLIANQFPVPESLSFPKFQERNVLCRDNMCSVMGEVKYKNQYGVKVTGEYESLLLIDDEKFELYKFNMKER